MVNFKNITKYLLIFIVRLIEVALILVIVSGIILLSVLIWGKLFSYITHIQFIISIGVLILSTFIFSLAKYLIKLIWNINGEKVSIFIDRIWERDKE